MDNFDTHKWFKKQYLEEGHTEDKTREIDRARIEAELEKNPNYNYKKDSETAEKVRAMLAREKKLRDYYMGKSDVYPLKENMSPGEAVTELNFLMDDLRNISGEVKQIMRQTFPDEFDQGDAYGAFDFGSSRNQYDTTFESILNNLASVGDEDEMEDYD